jgi:polyphosphate kinase
MTHDDDFDQDSSEDKDQPARSSRYLNKELSWLEFNARVLAEAHNQANPLLERLKFLAIFSSNLDEFFMVRVAGLKKMEQEALHYSDSPDAADTSTILSQIRQKTLELVVEQFRCLKYQVLPELEQYGIRILKMADLSGQQALDLERYFETEVSPVLTPLGVDPAHPFPFLSNQSMHLLVVPKPVSKSDGEIPIGFVEIPSILPRLIEVKSESSPHLHYILLEDLIAAHLSSLFFGLTEADTYLVRVIRNLDYNLLENKVVDLLKSIQKEMLNREHQEVVRIDIEDTMPQGIRQQIKNRLGLSEADLFEVPRPLHIPGLMGLYRIPLDHLKDPPFNPRIPPVLAGNDDIFSVIARKDLLVHHPYESFYAVTDFLHSAAHDPQVLAIKQTLYRSAGDSPIIDSLISAAENGKQVTAVIELKARFDEKNNISWARRLERAGVNVVFGFVGLKTHCKAVLVVRREGERLVRYAHLSTGNYNSNTAKLYTDLGFFTANPAIGADLNMIFNLVTGFDVLTGSVRIRDDTIKTKLTKVALAPLNLRERIIHLIQDEMDHHQKTGRGFIMAKMNALVDKDLVDQLYKASALGVRIQLIVRGTCCLRPGIKGLSEHIEVISIVDRFLEHSRIFYFFAGGEQKVFLASSDWMPRNMDRRIEIMWPIEHPDIKMRIIGEILPLSWADNTKARCLRSDGTYHSRSPQGDEPAVRSQLKFIEIAREGGVQSVPYEIAIRHKHMGKKLGQKPIARKKSRKAPDPLLEADHSPGQDGDRKKGG